MFLAAAPYFYHRFQTDDWAATHYQPSILTVSTVTNLGSSFILAKLQKVCQKPTKMTKFGTHRMKCTLQSTFDVPCQSQVIRSPRHTLADWHCQTNTSGWLRRTQLVDKPLHPASDQQTWSIVGLEASPLPGYPRWPAHSSRSYSPGFQHCLL